MGYGMVPKTTETERPEMRFTPSLQTLDFGDTAVLVGHGLGRAETT
jgi:hypothetical protein